MNKTAIRNYAVWARVQLIESAKQRAFEYDVTEGGVNDPDSESVGGRLLTKEERKQRRQLTSEINHKGYSRVMEEVAYTWFNRFVALRFMEINGYLPGKTRLFTAVYYIKSIFAECDYVLERGRRGGCALIFGFITRKILIGLY